MKLFQSVLALSLMTASLSGCSDGQTASPGSKAPANATSVADGQAEYTVLVYMNGSDLESEGGAASSDLEEMMNVGSSDNVNIVVETGGTNKWGFEKISNEKNQRWLVKAGDMELVQDADKRSMGEANTLTDFITWGVEHYPAKKYALVMWDHGAGSVHGFGSDELFEGDSLTLDEMTTAFAKAFEKTKTKFEVVGFDACLMANLETAKVVSPFANYLVASEELEPGHGWNYTPVLQELTANPAMTGDALGKSIADHFKEQAKQEGTADSITLSVVNLAKVGEVETALDGMVANLSPGINDVETVKWVSNARYKSEDYGSAGAHGGNTDMADLADLAKHLEPKYQQQATNLSNAIQQAVVYNITSKSKPHAKGLSIYFPSKDKENFASNLEIYKKNKFSPAYQEYIAAYASRLLGNTKPIAFVAAKPKELPAQQKPTDSPTSGDNAEQPMYEVQINPEDVSSITELYSIVGRYAPGSETKVQILGIDNYDVELDEKTGTIKGYFAGEGAMLNGQYVSLFLADQNEEYTEYSIPVVLNGKEVDIMVLYSHDSGETEILGAWPGINKETNIPDKDLIRLKAGDKITPLYYYYDESTDAEGYDKGTEFVVGEELKMDFEHLPKGDYVYGFYTVDYAQNENYSDMVEISIDE
ncbi:clostripain-related cysteine peptidase [Brevibacillus fluminis]|uniref:clostripain-related cysteine peptidase n=1 Tax=Brevibacillus fluminis TaxID=511487 RepID=UPI003F8BD480